MFYWSVICLCFVAFGFRSPRQGHQRQINRHFASLNPGARAQTAVIIVDHGSRRAEANDMLLTVAAAYKSHSQISVVEAAHMEMAEPSISTAYKRCVELGAKHIICHPFFLSPGRHVQEDIPALMKEASLQYPDVTYSITSPLGMQSGIIELISKAINDCHP